MSTPEQNKALEQTEQAEQAPAYTATSYSAEYALATYAEREYTKKNGEKGKRSSIPSPVPYTLTLPTWESIAESDRGVILEAAARHFAISAPKKAVEQAVLALVGDAPAAPGMKATESERTTYKSKRAAFEAAYDAAVEKLANDPARLALAVGDDWPFAVNEARARFVKARDEIKGASKANAELAKLRAEAKERARAQVAQLRAMGASDESILAFFATTDPGAVDAVTELLTQP